MQLKKSTLLPNKTIQISGSKSESNRLLILQKLWGNFEVKNLSNSQDTKFLQKALASDEEVINIHHAGTAMRFLTAFFAIQEGRTTILTGSERMKERPIFPLVEALRALGADIEYLEKEGFPPLKIIGKKITKNEVEIPAHISSQFITALMLIGTKLQNGLTIHLKGKITSKPYLEMTLEMISQVAGRRSQIESKEGNTIIKIAKREQQNANSETQIVESDWSSASYFYSLTAIGREIILLESFKENSLQGDKKITEIYEKFFGVETIFANRKSQIANREIQKTKSEQPKANSQKRETIILIPKPNFSFPKKIELDMNDCPDIAQTLCVTASAMKIPFKITGLETLKIKETDRLLALQNELLKIGVKTEITENSIQSTEFFEPTESISIATYNDHRMAMSFAPFCLVQELEIQNPDVVEKSYPDFWRDFSSLTK